MNKFDNPESPNFRLVRDTIRGLVVNAPVTLNRRTAAVHKEKSKKNDSVDPKEIQTNEVAVEHPDTLPSINIARRLDNREIYEDLVSKRPHKEELGITMLGVQHPDTLNNIKNNTNVLAGEGSSESSGSEETKSMHSTIVELRAKMLNTTDPNILYGKSCITSVLDSLEKRVLESPKGFETESALWDTVKWQRMVLGEEHPATLTSMNNLASVLDSRGDHHSALSIFMAH